ncbi:Cache 3/Cache 2 fusion domain-containing protein [Methylovorus menthalis]|uniref:Cache 3/Cache 2 fusion domain-containing protein n=1 Tax=Methylovorus menthalis TaxID=1002227 RepID=UPI001E2C2224|nr:Cache 3/Cache 2 fusion domain-containing protein [Methylovorus menthalis]MCB4812003.1 Cache 3/Cache 2 fusion domain-containing protein [Methylovorus menthalis]
MKRISTVQRFLLPIAILIILAAILQAYFEYRSKLATVEQDAQAQTRASIQLLQTTENLVHSQVIASMRLLRQNALNLGLPAISSSTLLNGKRIPNLVFGNHAQTGNFSVVDEVTRINGGTATLFVRAGDDFIRISTNVHQLDGSRAIGTVLDPKGRAIEALREGKPFYGVVDILGNPYITGYEPMFDAEGKLIGIWYVGFQADMDALRTTMESTRFLETGFAAMLDSHHHIRFLSSHIKTAAAERLIAERPATWRLISQDVPSWGFNVVYAYPKKEAAVQGMLKALYVLLSGLVGLGVLALIVQSQLTRLVIKPIGGDPELAVALVRKIASGNLQDDGLTGQPNTLIAHMITMRNSLRRMMDTLRSNSENLSLAASVFEHAGDGIFIADARLCIVQVNPSFVKITGFSAEEAKGKNPQELSFAIHDPKSLLEMIYCVKKDGQWRGELQNINKRGETYLISIDVSSVTNQDGLISHYVGTFSDITLMKRQQESLQHMAYHDTLTQLPNRALFADRLRQALARTSRTEETIAVCYMDLDGFKPINDTLGHEAGDELLIKLSERVKESLRSGDTIARMGGDEFALLLCNLRSGAEARDTLDRILQNIKHSFQVKNHEVRISASAGMFLNPSPDHDLDFILSRADHCMYLAKTNAELDFYVYDPTMEPLRPV